MSKDKKPEKQLAEKNNEFLPANLERRLQEFEQENRMLKIKNEYLEKSMSLWKQRQMKEKQESSKDSEKNPIKIDSCCSSFP